MSEVFAPADVVAGVIGFLRKHGVDAASKIPLDRDSGFVRVTRVGGQPLNQMQEQAEILIETWETSQGESFNLARRLWGLFALVSVDDQTAFPGITCYKAVPSSMPVQYPDVNAPALDRHQFTVSMTVKLERIQV